MHIVGWLVTRLRTLSGQWTAADGHRCRCVSDHLSIAHSSNSVTSVTVGGPFAATVDQEPDRRVPGFPATNFWLGELRVAGQPATGLDSSMTTTA